MTGAVELLPVRIFGDGRAYFERPAKLLPPGFLLPGDTVSFRCLFTGKTGAGLSREYVVTFTG